MLTKNIKFQRQQLLDRISEMRLALSQIHRIFISHNADYRVYPSHDWASEFLSSSTSLEWARPEKSHIISKHNAEQGAIERYAPKRVMVSIVASTHSRRVAHGNYGNLNLVKSHRKLEATWTSGQVFHILSGLRLASENFPGFWPGLLFAEEMIYSVGLLKSNRHEQGAKSVQICTDSTGGDSERSRTWKGAVRSS